MHVLGEVDSGLLPSRRCGILDQVMDALQYRRHGHLIHEQYTLVIEFMLDALKRQWRCYEYLKVIGAFLVLDSDIHLEPSMRIPWLIPSQG